MAAVEVFVDDAIRGRLPSVCVRTGQPADMTVRFRRSVGPGMGFLWLLVLFGPPGWLGIIVLSFVVPGQEQLTVRLPYSRAAWDVERARRRGQFVLAASGCAAVVLAIGHAGPVPSLWLAAGVGLLGAAFLLWADAYFREVGIYLDGSRRWVTLSRVHPAFAEAVALPVGPTGSAAR